MDGRAIKAEKNGQRGRDSALTPPKALSLPPAVALGVSKAGHVGPRSQDWSAPISCGPRLAGWWVWVVAICPLHSKLVVFPLNENLSVVPCLSVRVGGIDRGADCLLLSSVWGGVLAIYDDRPFVIVECDDMLNTSHKVLLPRLETRVHAGREFAT